ncbi:TonB-dependent siderophore receptor [Salmonella enterica subsp. enterica]|uniref:TonB-dependent siderophore receptor n=1 Tax=Salmonella enterica TaxID=28901 RepID=UPI00193DF430|nr:TonB-dependent siderophore receptor [Salmonella enterica]EDW1488852.1 TonB-dependent siderophore receptor [Salmonella enterica subsp. enterica serovar Hvittingfoss]EEH4116810.1 TonB-dependent siderophore receptor [Salmonella enterica subsp. enterica serovar Hvittingfoss]EEJ7167404.1 TonB-dependent siderophore receptor [Salmonella enterica subsp. enterica serovar Hvittingfoss]EIO3280160.1 TonB-dependent siderophore receptor [Salmonella enterica]
MDNYSNSFSIALITMFILGLGVSSNALASDVVHKNKSIKEPKTKDNSDVIIVTATPYSAESTEWNQTTLSKLPLTLREIPQSVSLVSKDRIEQQNFQSLDDALANSTGFTIVPAMQYTNAWYVRGVRVNSVELDGIPQLLGAAAGMPEDLAAYDKIELLRGSNGLLHGTGNPSATINLIRKRAPKDPLLNFKSQAGSWQYYREQVDVGGPLNDDGTLRGLAVLAWSDKHQFYDRAKEHSRLAYGTVESDLTPSTLLRLGAEYQQNTGNPRIGGLPMASNGDDLQLPRKTNLDAPWSSYNFYTTRLFMEVNQKINDLWQGKFNIDYQHATSNVHYGVFYGSVNKNTGDGGGILFGGADYFNNNQLSFDTNLTGKIDVFGLEHQLVLGASYTNAHIDRLGSGYKEKYYIPINVYHFDISHLSEPSLNEPSTVVHTREINKGLYGLARIKLATPLSLIIGGRENWYQQSSLKSETETSGHFTPYGGLIWDFSPNWSWYASYADVYQPQNYQTYDGKLVDPLLGKTYETGFKNSILNDTLNTSIAIFRMDMENTALIDPLHSKGRMSYYMNGGQATTKGIELETNGYLTPYWTLYAGYTYSKTTTGKTTGGGNVSTYNSAAPRNIFRLWTNYDLPWDQRRWSIGSGIQAQSHYTSAYGKNVRQGGFTLFNARLSYMISDNWKASLNIDNIFDRHYYSALFSPEWSNYYGTPRNVALTIEGSL